MARALFLRLLEAEKLGKVGDKVVWTCTLCGTSNVFANDTLRPCK